MLKVAPRLHHHKGCHNRQLHSILYYVQKDDPLGPVPENPANDYQFYNWESGVINWAKVNVPNFYGYNVVPPNSF